MRISELLDLVWADVDFAAGLIRVRAQLSRAHGGEPARGFLHDLRHTFASHLIVDLGLDVAQGSRIMGHASITNTLNVYTHLFDDAREIREGMAASQSACLTRPRVR